MAVLLKKLRDKKTFYWNGMVYGGPGVGKTVLTSTSRKLRTFVFDVDDGTVSTKTWAALHGIDNDVTIAEVRSKADFLDAHDQLVRRIREFDLVVVDTATELQRLILREIQGSTSVLDQRGWGIGLTAMEKIVSAFRFLPAHVIWTAHEMSKPDAEGMPERYRPSFQGAFKNEHEKHWSIIGRYVLVTKVEKIESGEKAIVQKRAIDFGPTPTAVTKDRSGFLSRDRFVEPNIDTIFEMLAAATDKMTPEQYDEAVALVTPTEAIDAAIEGSDDTEA
jgi:AAA domain